MSHPICFNVMAQTASNVLRFYHYRSSKQAHSKLSNAILIQIFSQTIALYGVLRNHLMREILIRKRRTYDEFVVKSDWIIMLPVPIARMVKLRLLHANCSRSAQSKQDHFHDLFANCTTEYLVFRRVALYNHNEENEQHLSSTQFALVMHWQYVSSWYT